MSISRATPPSKAISVEQVQLLGIRIATSPLHKLEAEETGIEVDIGLHVGGDAGNVVKATCHSFDAACGHLPASRARTFCTAGSAAILSCSACTLGYSVKPPGKSFIAQRIIGKE
jgi:hypothetical protein